MTGDTPRGTTAAGLAAFYRSHLQDALLPFWARAVDHANGGVYTSFDNSGRVLLNRNKYTWSQGRYIWLMAHLSELCGKGLVEGDPLEYRERADRTVAFLRSHVFLESGNCAFLLSETGEKLESIPGAGFDTSVYADCFFAIGLCEHARVFGSATSLELASSLYASIRRRLSTGEVRSEPYAILPGYKAHGFPMIMLHLSEQLAAAMKAQGDPRFDSIVGDCAAYLSDIMDNFLLKDAGIVAEILAPESARGTILERHVNPGHTIECMWFAARAAGLTGLRDYIEVTARVTAQSFALGWDKEHGGLFHYVDRDGGMPKGSVSGDAFEASISATWDMKLWWPHSEALYSSLLAYSSQRDQRFLDIYRSLHRYTFSVFPNADKSVGEWIQIRNRKGVPEEKVVALPVKDPYHIMRNVMLIIELLSNGESAWADADFGQL
jgi:N-acylglucosamine 2-epimerase